MVDAPEAWEYPKPGTEDEKDAARAAEAQEAPQASTDPGAASSGNDKATHEQEIVFTRTGISSNGMRRDPFTLQV